MAGFGYNGVRRRVAEETDSDEWPVERASQFVACRRPRRRENAKMARYQRIRIPASAAPLAFKPSACPGTNAKAGRPSDPHGRACLARYSEMDSVRQQRAMVRNSSEKKNDNH